MPDFYKADFFVLRSPLLPFRTTVEFYERIRAHGNATLALQSIFGADLVREALYIASQPLFDDTLDLFRNKVDNAKDRNKIEKALFQYLIRMSTRSTPFGLFAMCTLGTMSDHTDILLDANNLIYRHLRLDMDYLCDFSRHVEKLPGIRQQLLYKKNDSPSRFKRFVGYTVMYDPNVDVVKWSEINFQPFGYLLAHDSVPPNDIMVDITSWSACDYDVVYKMNINTCYLEVDNLIPGTYK